MRRRFGNVCRRRQPGTGILYRGYYVRWVGPDGRRRCRWAGDTMAEAERVLATLAGEAAVARGDPLPLAGVGTLTLAEAAPRILAAWSTRLAEGTMRGRPAALRRWAERLGGKPLGAVTRLDVQVLADELASRMKPSSVETSVAILAEAFTALQVHLGFEGASPCKEVVLPRIQQRPRPHVRAAEIALLLQACREDVRGAVTLLADAGLRPAELFRLTWGETSFDLSALRLEQTKTYRTRTIPLTRRAQAALQAEAARLPGPPAAGIRIFPMSERAFRSRFQEAARKAGLAGLTPYDLRHAFASALLMGGAAPAVVRDLLGHSSIVTTDRYLRSLPGVAPREAIERLSQERGE